MINKPDWLKVPAPQGDTFFEIRQNLRSKKLVTVCEEAKCPNISECWNTGTATLMILGDTCTRACRFCAVKTGNPAGLIDENEPQKVAETISLLKLRYVVLTMVDRDDLPDGGVSHIINTLKAIRVACSPIQIELLAGDFAGNVELLKDILTSPHSLDVFAHNVETVERLTPRVRDARAGYHQSLKILRSAVEISPHIITKSSLMLGLGEEKEEIIQCLRDLLDAQVKIVTFGQYLQPTQKHLTVKRFVTPEEFQEWKQIAYDMGFRGVASGPLVRSSYKASELMPAISHLSVAP
jgi:lipoic acid synthetase